MMKALFRDRPIAVKLQLILIVSMAMAMAVDFIMETVTVSAIT